MNNLLNLQPLNTDVAALFLRVILGGLFVYHGYTKLTAFDDILPQFDDLLGIGSKLSLILLIFAEFACGFLVALGLLTRFTVIPIGFSMAVAFFIAHKGDPFMGKELPLLFLLLTGVIFVLGSGKFSVDRLIFKK